MFSTPDYFAMGRPVPRGAAASDILDPWTEFAEEDCDAWLIYLAAGRLTELKAQLPFPLPWIGWERDNILRWYRGGRFLRGRPQTLSAQASP